MIEIADMFNGTYAVSHPAWMQKSFIKAWDFGFLSGALTKGRMPSDLDGVIYVKDRLLFLEMKHGAEGDPAKAQINAFMRLSRDPDYDFLLINAMQEIDKTDKAMKFTTIHRIRRLVRRREWESAFVDCREHTADYLHRLVAEWQEDAEAGKPARWRDTA